MCATSSVDELVFRGMPDARAGASSWVLKYAAQTARDYARTIDSKIVLIDGKTLARLMIDYNIGVASVATYELKQVDWDYFAEV